MCPFSFLFFRLVEESATEIKDNFRGNFMLVFKILFHIICSPGVAFGCYFCSLVRFVVSKSDSVLYLLVPFAVHNGELFRFPKQSGVGKSHLCFSFVFLLT